MAQAEKAHTSTRSSVQERIDAFDKFTGNMVTELGTVVTGLEGVEAMLMESDKDDRANQSLCIVEMLRHRLAAITEVFGKHQVCYKVPEIDGELIAKMTDRYAKVTSDADVMKRATLSRDKATEARELAGKVLSFVSKNGLTGSTLASDVQLIINKLQSIEFNTQALCDAQAGASLRHTFGVKHDDTPSSDPQRDKHCALSQTIGIDEMMKMANRADTLASQIHAMAEAFYEMGGKDDNANTLWHLSSAQVDLTEELRKLIEDISGEIAGIGHAIRDKAERPKVSVKPEQPKGNVTPISQPSRKRAVVKSSGECDNDVLYHLYTQTDQLLSCLNILLDHFDEADGKNLLWSCIEECERIHNVTKEYHDHEAYPPVRKASATTTFAVAAE